MVSDNGYRDITIRAKYDSALRLIKLILTLYDVLDLETFEMVPSADQESSPRKMREVRTAPRCSR
jgi:hypothetical protein